MFIDCWIGGVEFVCCVIEIVFFNDFDVGFCVL